MTMTSRLLAVALLAGLGIGAPGVWAQAPSGALPSKIYTKRTAFKLPFRIDDKERGDLQEVRLYVKDGPNEPWTLKETAGPAQGDFTYRVAQDGEYWFSVVTVDKMGHCTPADVKAEPPGLIVVVDTKPPEFDVQPLTLTTGEPGLKCQVNDANPDLTKVKLEYQTDRGWQTLEPFDLQQGLYKVPDTSVKGSVRATVTDRAGNTNMREINLTASASSPLEGHTPVQPMTPAAPATPVVGNMRNSTGAPTLQLINSAHASLDYKLEDEGPSGIGKVEVWITRDEGQTWQFLCEDRDRHSPVDIDLPGEGLYGISLVVSNGAGLGGTPPNRGDVPDWWVEVDTTKPVAQLLALRPGTGDEACMFLINWTASDKNLKAEPIDLYYTTERQGPWRPVALGLKNTGSYRWPVPHGIGPEFYFRMDVTDKAGNVT
ncbi:MAG: hypothetical protein JO112_06600, partial [Planctomycetes bacterium]|nr:hypothetical protein [Planctomycetota bacterium]